MKRILILAALAAGAWGQQQKNAVYEEPQQRVAQVFTIRYGGISQIAQALRTSGATVYEDQRLKTLVVSAPRSLMQNFAEIVQKLDVPAEPPKNVEVITYLLEASGQSAQSGNVPAVLNPVTKQLTELFGYSGFRVLDAALVRTREGEQANTQGKLTFGTTSQGYYLQFRPSVLTSAKGRVIRMERFSFDANALGAQVRADFEIGEGQKVVVGKTGLEGPDRALVLVVTGRVID